MSPADHQKEFLIHVKNEAGSSPNIDNVLSDIKNDPQIEIIDDSLLSEASAQVDLFKISATPDAAQQLQQKFQDQIDVIPNDPLPRNILPNPTLPPE
ncbi:MULTISPECIES: hypothetical protein [Methylobacterium]|uniref:hypothetical protein n=1 Tax=Methylobacterium TaxID=407 RepID=UPI0013EDC06B|nr:hypothetical protein [Methylobacterium sp. DB0501]NGM32380.1 hypothetical protein [Methylobacterium sp. DB0501]